MANTYHQIYLQAVFAAKYRAAVLEQSWRKKIFALLGNLINENHCRNLLVNGVEDHLHCLFSIKPIMSVSELMKAIKSKSSKYINDHHLTPRKFEWQEGYGVFSYSKGDIDNVFNYISSQEEHHKKRSFREEYLGLLNEFNISYDEQYIFQELK